MLKANTDTHIFREKGHYVLATHKPLLITAHTRLGPKKNISRSLDSMHPVVQEGKSYFTIVVEQMSTAYGSPKRIVSEEIFEGTPRPQKYGYGQ